MNILYDEITVRIRPLEGTVIVEEHTGNAISVKNICPDDLLKCFEKGMKETKSISSGFLPDNCISYEVSNLSKILTLWIPPGHIDCIYHKTVYERFPMPAMAFSITVGSNGRTSAHRLTVIADEPPTPKTPLYLYPFSNVYDDGGICIGAANVLPLYKNIRPLGTLPYHILGLPNNDHQFAIRNNKQKLSYRDLLEHLKDKDPSYYYEHVLIPNGAVLQDFISEDKKGGAFRYAA